MGSISVRKSIRWLPGNAEEPTSTLVLTSPERRFVDLRILKDDKEDSLSEKSYQTSLSPDRLDWAIAGTSRASSQGPAGGTPLAAGVDHVVWRHWIDSRTDRPEDVVDEGDVVEQADGTVLETGRGVNPATGVRGEYEEVWQDEEVGGEACVVLCLDDGARRGMVVRVGRFCQGLVVSGMGLALERWRRNDEGRWVRVVRMGVESVPCGLAKKDDVAMKPGQELGEGFEGWMVVEAHKAIRT